jgi:ABC-type nitrate/sulfonate/bicarbonate transport system substrate-binding protein
VARQQDFFAQQGLHIDISYTTGSIPQLTGLVREEYQLIQTAPDNVINVDNNPTAFGLEQETAPHISMILGGSVGPLSIFAQRDITSFDHLRGSVLGVDNPTSGFAIVLRDILARNGLLLERDYTFTVAGGRAIVLMHSKVALLQQQYSMHPLTCKQHGQVLASSLPQLTITPLIPHLLPLVTSPGSSNILTK